MNGNKYKYTDEGDVVWRNYKEYVFVKLLRFCDCRDEKLYSDIFSILEAYRKAGRKNELIHYDKLLVGNPREYVELILRC